MRAPSFLLYFFRKILFKAKTSSEILITRIAAAISGMPFAVKGFMSVEHSLHPPEKRTSDTITRMTLLTVSLRPLASSS